MKLTNKYFKRNGTFKEYLMVVSIMIIIGLIGISIINFLRTSFSVDGLTFHYEGKKDNTYIFKDENYELLKINRLKNVNHKFNDVLKIEYKDKVIQKYRQNKRNAI